MLILEQIIFSFFLLHVLWLLFLALPAFIHTCLRWSFLLFINKYTCLLGTSLNANVFSEWYKPFSLVTIVIVVVVFDFFFGLTRNRVYTLKVTGWANIYGNKFIWKSCYQLCVCMNVWKAFKIPVRSTYWPKQLILMYSAWNKKKKKKKEYENSIWMHFTIFLLFA